MLARKAFFSFTEILDPSMHQTYNAWHQLDHRPENLALPGVAYGERWVRTPGCFGAGTVPEPVLAGTHYVNMYWFREPAAESIVAWQELAERSFQWGRRPEAPYTTRSLMGFFSTVKGYVNPRVQVSADALPYRPVRGVLLSVHRLREPHAAVTQDLMAWYDQVRIPDLVGCRGVAGAWTFSSDSTTLDPSWQSSPGRMTFVASGSDQGAFRVHLLFLDEDPLEVQAEVAAHEAAWDAAGRGWERDGVEEQVFASPLRAIIPWSWDWFDEGAPPS